MNLAPWTDIPWGDEDALLDFYMVHGMTHNNIANVMYAQDLFYVTYPLMDAKRYDKDWLLIHQAEHESIYSQIGLQGMPDLASVDFGKEDEFYDWHLLHKQVHANINAVLGIVT